MHGSFTSDEEKLVKPFPLLPFEIISSILFQILSKAWNEGYDSETAFTRLDESQDVLSASQVCHHWRSVALQLPKLWASIVNIDLDTDAWIRELLSRSGNFPLDIESDPGLDESPSFSKFGHCAPKWGWVFREMHRIRTLHLLVLQSEDYLSHFHIVGAMNKPAPLIESFKLTTDAPYFKGYNLWRLPLSGRLFDGTAPKLREVLLQGMGIPRNRWVPNMKLRSLCVCSIADEPSLSPYEWLSVIEEQPQLSSIYIEDRNAFPQNHLGQGALHRPVVLNNLVFLTIIGQQGFINEILPTIEAPRTKGSYILELKSRRPQLWDQDNSGIFKGLANLFDSLRKNMDEDCPCSDWKICYLPDSRLTVDAFTCDQSDDEPMLSISMELSQNQDNHNATILALFDLLCTKGLLTEADTLKLQLPAELDYEEVTSRFLLLMDSCRKVSELVLMGKSTVHQTATLLAYWSHFLPAGTQSPLPNIDLLVYNEDQREIERVDFILFALLEKRFRDGMKIPRLRMCLKEPEYALSLFNRRPILKNLDVILEVTEAEVWDVDFRTPFPGLFQL